MAAQRPNQCEEAGCNGCSRKISYCVDCSCWLCDNCWPNYRNHAGGRRGRDGLEHERTTYHVFKKLESILTPCSSLSALEELHSQDLDTTWFGVRKNSNPRPLLADYDVYSSFMGQPPPNGGAKIPQLASFIGQTNAGKSTLVKMLIKLNDKSADEDNDSQFPTPVVGSAIQSHDATSADVHLYADPCTYNTRTPLLYADCEGFEGGSKDPFGAVENRVATLAAGILPPRLSPGRTRELEWADEPEKRNREFVVKQLYPRILYTFSDAVVFVLRNAKTFESSVFRPMLEWGEASLEKSVNQPTLPNAIIVLNDTDLAVPPEEWDIHAATTNLLEANRFCLDSNGHPFFIQLANQWRARGKPIDTILDIIHCYYATFKVVRIPTKGRYQLMHNQVQKLHSLITDCCDLSFNRKREARMLSTSEELNIYLQSAFDHFAKTLDQPFNFVEVSLRNNPIPDNFGGHILQLALAVQAYGRRQNSTWIFEMISSLIASSVMLDCVRHRKGQPDDLLIEYEHYFRYALEEFSDLYSPCEFRTKSEKCVNCASTHHPKGHQNAKGKIIGTGRYYSRFQADRYYTTWRDRIKNAVTTINLELQESLRGSRKAFEEDELLKIHSNLMDQLYARIGSAEDFQSHSSCFCCLMKAPQHKLPCGHVLCTECVRSYANRDTGQNKDKCVLTLRCCPMHPARTQWPSPCIIRLKPDYAGVRLLSLDGGGMRGIVELEVLRAIQGRLNNRIPLRAFFDLIIGTSTGGIIALGFGVKNWDIEECIRRFKKVCQVAYTPRTLHNVPMLKHVVTLKHGAKYKTTPLRNALQGAFGQNYLFGSNHDASIHHAAKVAVTATDEVGKTAIVLANYSREESSRKRRRKTHYDFPRPDNPYHELKIWEAAAATSAAPYYFKPFIHGPTKRQYLDGAIYHNNPVRQVNRERKLIWPDVANKHPDLLLSIGTGQNEEEVKRGLGVGPWSSRRSRRRARREDQAALKPGKAAFPRSRQMYAAMQNRIDSIMDAEFAWKEFCWDVTDSESSDGNALTYVRINPNIGREPPSLDDVGELKRLQEEARSSLKTPQSLSQLDHVALVLVATSFYYERNTAPRSEKNGVYSCAGRICCRFEDGSDYLRALGDYFRDKQQTSDFGPYFEIEEDGSIIQTVLLLPEHVTRMRDLASFSIDMPDIRTQKQTAVVTISMYLRSRHTKRQKFPISGFPRQIMAEQSQKVLSQAEASTTSPFERQINRSSHRASTGLIELNEAPGFLDRPGRSVSDPQAVRYERRRENGIGSAELPGTVHGSRNIGPKRSNSTLELHGQPTHVSAPVNELPTTTPVSHRRRSLQREVPEPHHREAELPGTRQSVPELHSVTPPTRSELEATQPRVQQSYSSSSAPISPFNFGRTGNGVDGDSIQAHVERRMDYLNQRAGKQALREIERNRVLEEEYNRQKTLAELTERRSSNPDHRSGRHPMPTRSPCVPPSRSPAFLHPRNEPPEMNVPRQRNAPTLAEKIRTMPSIASMTSDGAFSRDVYSPFSDYDHEFEERRRLRGIKTPSVIWSDEGLGSVVSEVDDGRRRAL